MATIAFAWVSNLIAAMGNSSIAHAQDKEYGVQIWYAPSN
jgi:hypothetical protein